MTILFAASEMEPLAHTGGLGDVLEALPAALAARGHEVSVVLPCYTSIISSSTLSFRSTGVRIQVPVGYKQVEAEILEGVAPNGVQTFLVKQDEYFGRPELYGAEGRAYEDNAERFIFFSRAVMELSRRILPPPEIIHVHDWQTALVPVLAKERRLQAKTVLTVHNLAYQGSFWAQDFGLTSLPGSYFSAGGVEFYGSLNLLKGGIVSADAVTTVSERYACEMQTREYGFGLDAVLREQRHKLSGILNGVDEKLWNPANDPSLPANYSGDDFTGKNNCRELLLSRLDLDPTPAGPVFGIVSRVAAQKGLDLLLPLVDRLLANDARLVLVGGGDKQFERELTIAARQHKRRFTYISQYEHDLAHLVIAGSDMTLIPSYYEPCGLAALYSLKYGTVPIARATGGLYESIQDYDPGEERGNGFLFHTSTSAGLWDGIKRAKQLFSRREDWEKVMKRAMAADFSWDKAAGRYESLYRKLLGR